MSAFLFRLKGKLTMDDMNDNEAKKRLWAC